MGRLIGYGFFVIGVTFWGGLGGLTLAAMLGIFTPAHPLAEVLPTLLGVVTSTMVAGIGFYMMFPAGPPVPPVKR